MFKMKRLILPLIGLANSNYVPGVPDKTGSFFYLELEKGLQSEDIDLEEYQYMFHAKGIVGSNRTRAQLQVSSLER